MGNVPECDNDFGWSGSIKEETTTCQDHLLLPHSFPEIIATMSTEKTMEKMDIARADTEAVSIRDIFFVAWFTDSYSEQGEVHIIPLEKAGVDAEAAKRDKALGLLATHHVDFDSNSAEAKRVLRKIDMRIMPMVFIVYLLQLMASPFRICSFRDPTSTSCLGQKQLVIRCDHGYQD